MSDPNLLFQRQCRILQAAFNNGKISQQAYGHHIERCSRIHTMKLIRQNPRKAWSPAFAMAN